MGKKFLSTVLCAAMILSAGSAAMLNASADGNADYGLPEKTSDGVILHAFDWSFNTIKDNLPAIAEAGYTAVQTSPVQPPKDYGESWNDTAAQWWKLYQPLSFSVATKNSWVGTKAELIELCDEADKYGIKIICDIVSNHMASGSSSHSISEDIKEYDADIYDNQTKYFHQLHKQVGGDDNIEKMLQGELSKLPDYNTGDEDAQKKVISLLEECIDCGVDGFRFDAAKHIETPADGEYASNFWPNVIGAATDYAQEKGVELYCYGEVLNTPGKGRNVTDYTQYLDVTDNKTGDTTLAAVVKKNADVVVKAQNYQYSIGNGSPSDYVLWAESHDTYMGDSGSAGISNTSNVSNEDIAKAWALVASRSESRALYLARPGVLMDQAADTAWKSTVVSEVNKFHNKFVGVSDQVYNDGDVVAVQRGDSGIVLVNLGDSASADVSTQGMKDGAYTDAVTGNAFTVKDGKISGSFGSTGIAVVYADAAATPKAIFSVMDKTSFRTDTIDVTITLENAQNGTYSVNGGDKTAFSGSTTVTLGEGVTSGDIKLTVEAINDNKTVVTTQTYTKLDVEHSGVFVYLNKDSNKLTKNWKNVYVFAFYDEKDSEGNILNTTMNSTWPGVPMDYDQKEGLYFYELPVNLKIGEANVIFTDAAGNQTKDLPVTVNNMILYNDNFVDKSSIVEEPKNKVELKYGNVDGSDGIDAADSLKILRASVMLEEFTAEQNAQADVDGDKEITSSDALFVLRYSVGFNDSNAKVGTMFNYYEDGTIEDIAEKNTFYLINKAGWIFNYGAKLWLVNNETNEAIETNKESPLDDSSKYAYIDLPAGWKNISVYRTDYDVSEITESTTIHNKWNCGEIENGCNGVQLRDSGKSKYVSYDPE